MKTTHKTKKIITVIALLMAVCMCLAGCGSSKENTANQNQNSSTPQVPENTASSALNFTQEEIVKMANRSKTVLELLEALFPDSGIMEDGSTGYAFGAQHKATEAETKVLSLAAGSRSVLEFLENLYPDKAIYRDDDNGYQLEPLRDYLQKNSYNWSDLSSAIKGIDVSKWQNNINWQQVKASGVGFVFIRLGYRGYVDGSIMKDETFDANIQGATASGIPVGVYFASKARNTNEAKEEAEWIIDQLKPYNITWPLVLDVEIQDETDRVSNLDIDTRTNNVITACDMLKEAGYTPMIYSNPKVLIARLDYTKLEAYPKWVAEYQNLPHYPYSFQIWQASETGKVDGIEGDVDINYSMVDFAQGWSGSSK